MIDVIVLTTDLHVVVLRDLSLTGHIEFNNAGQSLEAFVSLPAHCLPELLKGVGVK